MEIRELLDRVIEAWKIELYVSQKMSLKTGRRKDDGWRPDYVYASRRHPCVRKMALDLLHPEDEPAFTPERLEAMRKGVETEAAFLQRLREAGKLSSPPFRVVEEQVRFRMKDRDGTLLISGKCDARLAFQGVEHRPVVEVKAGRTFQNCTTIEDLDRGKWTRNAVDQLLSYLLATEEPWGFFGITGNGSLPTLIPVELEPNLARAEQFLKDARTAIDARLGKTELPPYTEEKSLCKMCPHLNKTCSPDMDYGPGVQIMAEPVIWDACDQMVRNEQAYLSYNRAKKALQENARGVELALVTGGDGPDFEIRGKWSSQTTYDVPDDVKTQYKKVDPKGRFTLKVTSTKAAE